MEAKLTVPDLLAIYAAALSTVVFSWNLMRARPKIRVRVCLAVDDRPDGKSRVGIGIFVQNPSAHTVHITNISLLYPFRPVTILGRIKHVWEYRSSPLRIGWCSTALSLYGVDDRCPASIEPGQSHYVFVEQEALDEILEGALSRLIIAAVQDALWRTKYSKKFLVSTRGAKK